MRPHFPSVVQWAAAGTDIIIIIIIIIIIYYYYFILFYFIIIINALFSSLHIYALIYFKVKYHFSVDRPFWEFLTGIFCFFATFHRGTLREYSCIHVRIYYDFSVLFSLLCSKQCTGAIYNYALMMMMIEKMSRCQISTSICNAPLQIDRWRITIRNVVNRSRHS